MSKDYRLFAKIYSGYFSGKGKGRGYTGEQLSLRWNTVKNNPELANILYSGESDADKRMFLERLYEDGTIIEETTETPEGFYGKVPKGTIFRTGKILKDTVKRKTITVKNAISMPEDIIEKKDDEKVSLPPTPIIPTKPDTNSSIKVKPTNNGINNYDPNIVVDDAKSKSNDDDVYGRNISSVVNSFTEKARTRKVKVNKKGKRATGNPRPAIVLGERYKQDKPDMPDMPDMPDIPEPIMPEPVMKKPKRRMPTKKGITLSKKTPTKQPKSKMITKTKSKMITKPKKNMKWAEAVSYYYKKYKPDCYYPKKGTEHYNNVMMLMGKV